MRSSRSVKNAPPFSKSWLRPWVFNEFCWKHINIQVLYIFQKGMKYFKVNILAIISGGNEFRYFLTGKQRIKNCLNLQYFIILRYSSSRTIRVLHQSLHHLVIYIDKHGKMDERSVSNGHLYNDRGETDKFSASIGHLYRKTS